MMAADIDPDSQPGAESCAGPSSAALSLEALKRAYDAEVKNFLKEKQILAVILRSAAAEFRDCSLADIEKYIEGTPQVSRVAVDQDAAFPPDSVGQSPGSRIEGSATEDRSINEGLVTYDIRFNARAPASGDLIKLIINVEAQRESRNQSYPMVKRGLYYAARLISAQKNVEFTGMHYEKIKKVYSIWILQDAPAGRRNSIAAYDITERVITADNETGFSAEPVKNYDLLSVVMMSPGDPDTKRADQALRMLSTAFSEKLTAAAKKQILAEEFGIRMTEPVGKVVDTMCNLSYGIEERAEARGVAIGEARGEARGVAIGEARGVAIGEARGVAIGEARGELNMQIRIARTMIRRKRDTDAEIAEATGLPAEQVAELRLQEADAE